MRKTTTLGSFVALSAALFIGCSGGGGSTSVPPDEALERVRKAGGEFAKLGPQSMPNDWEKAAFEYFRPAALNYFEDMDMMGATNTTGAKKLELSDEAIKGRNAWVIWSAGNEAWWNWLAQYGYGTIDLLKLVDHTNRDSRFSRTGLINEPGTRPPSDDETARTYGVKFARPVLEKTATDDVHVEYRKDKPGWHPASRFNPENLFPEGGYGAQADPEKRYPVYGYPSGVVGLRLYPNPDFTTDAAERWKANLHLYYSDTKEGREYARHPDTIRPYRVGMSCGFCHIAPHPLNPPADPEKPAWANLSNNIGNQYMRIRAVFGNILTPDNYLYHVFDSQLPGAVDTSGYPSDNNNNPNTINSFFGLPGRVDRSKNIPKETISSDSITYLRKYVDDKFENPAHVPRVLLDGSDSVGINIALSRVYLNIGTHHQQWIRTINPLIGFRKQGPFKLNDIADNSLYWHATLLRVKPMADFFTASTDPMRLKDVVRPTQPAEKDKLDKTLKGHLRGTGLPWYTTAPPIPEAPKPNETKKDEPQKDQPKNELPKAPALETYGAGDYAKGRQAFAKGCIACHSSVQPGDLIYLEQKLFPPPVPNDFFGALQKFQTALSKRDGWGRLPALGALPADWESKPKEERERLLTAALTPRRALRLTNEDRARLARGDGQLPDAYKQWAEAAVHVPEFWEYKAVARNDDGTPVKDKNGKDAVVTTHNYLSIDERIPITVVRTNSGRAVATNSLHKHVWEDFASETYKELAPVGDIRYKDPFSGAEKTYAPPGGGPGYYRPATLISIWATAPFFHNNALGAFNNNPSVEGRLEAFDDAITRLLWPEKRAVPSAQVYWDGTTAVRTVPDAWYAGKFADPKPEVSKAVNQKDADGGWIWRTTEESWLQFDAPYVPVLINGVAGLPPFWARVIPWLPAVAFLVLGTLLLLSERLIAFRERCFAWLWWLLAPIWWALGAGGLVGAVVGVWLVLYPFRPMLTFLDVATQESFWNLHLLVVLFLAGAFGSFGLLFTIHLIPEGWLRRRIGQLAGATCLVLAVVAALSLGRFLSGHGAGLQVGPIPEGVPLNILANVDPNSSLDDKLAVLDKLGAFVVAHKNVKPGAPVGNPDVQSAARKARRTEFEQNVAPALLKASKCPDYVMDRGHDYEFIRHLTDEEKRELIALLKTF
ncbi:MAG TPA: hypothetical protein VGE74_20255 [Gemmata sp.]